jgi:hypothetical protein
MLICVAGLIGSGKGAVSDILIANGYVSESFAKPVKDAVSVMFGWDRELLEGSTAESREWREEPDDFWSDKFGYKITPRYILQQFGTDVTRNNLLDSIWIDSMEKRIIESKNTNIVISDLRFKNEAKFIKSYGGVIIQVFRGQYPDWYYTAYEDNKNNTNNMKQYYPDVHESEYSMIGNPTIDYIIDNNGTFEDLEKDILEILNDYN